MEEKYRLLLEKYLNDECSEQERAAVESWYHSLGTKFRVENSDKFGDIEKNWEAIREKIAKEEEEMSMPKSYSNWKVWMAAASVIFVLGISVLLYQVYKVGEGSVERHSMFSKTIKKKNNSNEKIKISLNDGSFVTLEPNSTLYYPQEFSENKREVTLEGEAFFEVERNENKPFWVYANNTITKVLGTSFIINSNSLTENVEVIVKTGKVTVETNIHTFFNREDDKKVTLTPNQKVSFNQDKDILEKKLVEEPIALIDKMELKKFTFVNAPIAEIFSAIESIYGVKIIYDDEVLRDCRMTTSLEDEKLHTKLEIICKLIGGAYEEKNANIIITSKGCL